MTEFLQRSCSSKLRLLTCLAVLLTCRNALSDDAQEWAVYQKTESIELFAEFSVDVPRIVAQLDSVRSEFQQLFGLSVDQGNVQLILFKSPGSYRAYLQHKIPEARHRRAIFYRNGDVYQVYAYRHADLIEDIRHEYAHALLHHALPYVPLWIDEGIAEFIEDQPADRENSARLSGMKWRCRSGWQPNLNQLEKIPSASSMTSAHYRDSWAWIHYLVNESDTTRGLLRDYLQAISAGEAPGAFTEWAPQRDTLVVKRVGSYFRRFRISLR